MEPLPVTQIDLHRFTHKCLIVQQIVDNDSQNTDFSLGFTTSDILVCTFNWIQGKQFLNLDWSSFRPRNPIKCLNRSKTTERCDQDPHYFVKPEMRWGWSTPFHSCWTVWKTQITRNDRKIGMYIVFGIESLIEWVRCLKYMTLIQQQFVWNCSISIATQFNTSVIWWGVCSFIHALFSYKIT